jgi:hypothetical protein
MTKILRRTKRNFKIDNEEYCLEKNIVINQLEK